MSRLYTIPLNGLKDDSYSYDYEVDGSFFRAFEGSEIGECNLRLTVELQKVSGQYNLRFLLSGPVLVVCDRCLGEYMYTIESDDRLIVKTGEKFDDSDPDLLIIPAGESELDLSQFIYDYSHLAIPIRKVHPEGPDGKSLCDSEMLRRLSNIDEDNAGSRPEWDKLRELLHDN
ncbi:MAG: DUF177 domain-containing protein [Bacteroidales bacterium]